MSVLHGSTVSLVLKKVAAVSSAGACIAVTTQGLVDSALTKKEASWIVRRTLTIYNHESQSDCFLCGGLAEP